MRKRAPECVVRRMRGGVEEVAGRRVSEVGKWPVWKVVLWRRRWPDIDLGSVMRRVKCVVFKTAEGREATTT